MCIYIPHGIMGCGITTSAEPSVHPAAVVAPMDLPQTPTLGAPGISRCFTIHLCFTVYIILWLLNIAMENDPFIDDFPMKTSIYRGFSMAYVK